MNRVKEGGGRHLKDEMSDPQAERNAIVGLLVLLFVLLMAGGLALYLLRT